MHRVAQNEALTLGTPHAINAIATYLIQFIGKIILFWIKQTNMASGTWVAIRGTVLTEGTGTLASKSTVILLNSPANMPRPSVSTVHIIMKFSKGLQGTLGSLSSV